MGQKLVTVTVAGQVVSVTGLYHHSQQVQPGGLFFALKDATYVAEAVRNGAIVVVTAADVVIDYPVTHIVVADVRETMALVAKQFYGNVADQMRIMGVVGTNGKTTTSYIAKHILETATGKNVGLIGTTGIYGAGQNFRSVINLTTPDPIDLHRALATMYQNGVRDVVMEVSAHAIYYRKVAGINFAAVVFTNITPDHLDFFSSFTQYKDTKLAFFKELTAGTVIINADDVYGQEVAAAVKGKEQVKAISFSLQKDSIVGTHEWAFVDQVQLTASGSDFNLSKIGQCHLALPGLFNVYNAVGAALACNSYGITWDVIKDAWQSMPAVPGRFNTYQIKGVTAVIDYAHTPDGLQKLLTNARGLLPPKAKLIVVFGCGGDRDKIKRPQMGALAVRLADFVVLTSDNPRTEDPEAILNDIERGIVTANVPSLLRHLDGANEKYIRITDRTRAINYAFDQANAGDMVVIAGKGHENYLDINGRKIPYSDREVLDTILRG